ncbi:conserved hypothetical protein [Vibrio chagasii]|nr:conserved hypothetical protein [Vibrio chagasii]
MRKSIGFMALIGTFLPNVAIEVQAVPLQLHEAREEQISDLSVHQLKRRFFPFNERQVNELKHHQEEQERFELESVRDPEIQQRTIPVNLSVGASDQNLYSSVNFQTNLIFIDSQGEPWPIEKYGVGASDFFDADQYLPHALEISPKRKYSKTNLTILLKGENVPLVFTINEDKDVVDYLAQIKVTSLRPGASSQGYSRPVSAASSIKRGDQSEQSIVDMRDGITPNDAKELIISKDDVSYSGLSAWQRGNSYYIRTTGEPIVPRGQLVSSGADGVKLFKLPVTTALMMELDGMIVTDIKLNKSN